MQRRHLLAAPAIVTVAATLSREAEAQAPRIVTEEFMVPTPTQGIEVFLRSKRPEGAQAAPGRTLLYVHGATYPAHTAFDLPLAGVSWMDYIAGRGFDVWSLDLPGYGRSTRPEAMSQPPEANPPLVRGDQAVAAIGAAAAFIRQQRGVPRMQMMAWSWGCSLIARYATENAAAVERLVLYAPEWLREQASQASPGAQLGAYRMVTQTQARERWMNGVPEVARANLIPPGWFEHWAGVTWATDPEGMRRNPSVLRAPNGVLLDSREYWQSGRPYWDPAKVTVPTLLVVGEWDRDTPPAMATTIFPLLTASPGKRCVLLGEGTHSMLMERNRGALYQAVQVFLEEAAAG
ncbi:alpha/beta hydrolase [Falsiroseomonas bella]|uniref:Alpha/beta hydrolase n=1 Tax=Falsiroseomonas bella TaxID=2184016 RepID=A0A317F9P3_9PROT|nr:alpha/beta hydrolase [Falsiroseomonas bella]PWS35485.1 alpha/beta hydrolase [Falsiroseomonas bella]